MSTTLGIESAGSSAGGLRAPLPGGDVGGMRADVDAQLVEETRNQIRTLVQEITLLADRDIPIGEFYDGLLSRIVSALVATGAVAWSVESDGKLRQAYRINLEATGLAEPSERHERLLRRTAGAGQPIAVPPQSGFPDDDSAGNPTDLLILLVPVLVEHKVVALLEVLQRPGAGPTTQRGYLRFLSQMADLTGHFLKNDRLRAYAEQQQSWRQLEGFLGQVHRSLDLEATAYSVVNEARGIVGCDRVSLAWIAGRRAQLAAVSGLDNLDRRADEAARLERLIEAAVAADEPFWFAGDRTNLPPQIERPLEAYVDASHAKAIGVLPVRIASSDEMPGEIVAAIVVERMTVGHWTETHRQRADTILRFASPAVVHALEHDRVFLRPLWTWLGTWHKRLTATAAMKLSAAAALAALLLLTLAFYPARFEVAARGKVQPSLRWDIFAPESGTVVSVPVRHGQSVAAGDVLAELTNTEIDVQLTELLGRQRVVQEQLDSARRALLDSGRSGRPRLTAADETRLGGDILQLKQTLAGVEQEIALMRRKQEQLVVRAEQDGEVVTWQVEQQLLRRPVQPGQSLMTVVDPHGPWELELHLPERRLKHVDAALARSEGKPLAVDFMLSTLPGRTFRGEVLEIERSAQVRGEEGNAVLVRVAFAREEMPPLRSDTTVTAKIACGRKPLGYVWFCDLIETVQTSVLFWF
jgi:multidrug resistance efflux pump